MMMMVVVMMMMLLVMVMLLCRCCGDGNDKVCWQQLFRKTPLQVPSGIGGVCPAGVLVVSPLCFGGRWCLAALWWCVRSVLTVFSDVLDVVVVFLWCLGTVPVVSWGY
jgi:hypothetical protein